MTPSPVTDPYAPFRPLTGTWVARVSAAASVVVFGLVAVFSPGYPWGSAAMDLLNRVMILGFGVALALFLLRYALIRAVPTTRGLLVVNLLRRREVAWAQIVRVGYSGGAPWAVLELTDTDELAVMAIQRADGQRARREASRLAALVEHHQRAASGLD